MEIVSGRTGSPHVTSQQFRQLVEGTVGQESYILTSGENLEPELASNNILKIRSGMMSHHGNISSIKIGTYDEVELTNGSQGMKRIDLVVNRYTRNAETNVEANNWVVITGTPVASDPAVPAYTVGNLQEGDLTDDCPVFEVHYDGLNVTEIKKLLDVADNLGKMKTELAELNGKIPFSTVLYDNTSGTKTDATLSDNVTNYEYVEIFYGNDLNGNDAYVPMRSIKTMLKDGYARARLLWFGSTSESETHQFSRLALELHDNTIHLGSENFVNFSSTAGSVKWSNASTKHFKIFRVIGWKH